MSKKRMNVYTDKGIYILLLDEYPEADGELTPEAIAEITGDLNVPGTVWKGWTPYDDPATTPPATIAFSVDAAIESIKIYDYEDVPVADDIEDSTVPTDVPVPMFIDLDYLGNKCHTKMVLYYHSGKDVTVDIVPYEINGVPAINALKPANIQSMVTTYFSTLYPVSDFRVFVPEVPLTANQAAEYIVNVNRGTADINLTGKAKAWNGWNNNDDASDDSEE